MVHTPAVDGWYGPSAFQHTQSFHRTDDDWENLLHPGARTVHSGFALDRAAILPVPAYATLFARAPDGVTFHPNGDPDL